MKYLAMATILTLAILVACETEDPVGETTIIVGEGSTIIVGEGVSVEEQPDQPLFVNRIVQDVVHKRHCGVGDTIIVQTTVLNDGDRALRVGQMHLETGNDDVRFTISTDVLLWVLQCQDYFKDGETYELKLFIGGIKLRSEREIERERNFRELDKEADLPTLEVLATLIMTQKLEKEIREAGCWIDQGQ